jgi:class 3 adenylate cyclase
MVRRSFRRGELLLVVLRLIEQQPMSEGEIFLELEALLGLEYRLTAGAVVIAVGALEAEGLVEAQAARGSVVYTITHGGREAVAQRADAVVLARADRAARSGGASERSPSHELEEVAVLFTDVVGSTELLDRLGDDEAHDLRRRHFVLLRRAVRDHGGHEVKSLGDGLMVVFESPRAALECAASMQSAVAACPDRLRLRVGIASGETIREDDDYFGRPVIVARRLCDAARGGDVLVSESTRERLGSSPGHELEPLEPLVLKGLSEPVAASTLRARPLALSA